MTSRAAAGGEIESLTGLRFLAAFHVMLFHNTVGFQSSLPRPVVDFIGMGDLAVTMFFVLSGFVLAYTYRGRARENLTGFYAARFARIYPVYLLGLIVAAPIFLTDRAPAMTSEQITGTVLAAGTLLQAWWPAAACKLNCPGWSLSVELVFYALFPFIAAWLAKFDGRKNLMVAAACVAVSFGLQWAQPQVVDAVYPVGAFPNEVRLMARANPLFYVPSFVLGVSLGLWYVAGGMLPNAKWLTPLAAGLVTVLYGSGVLGQVDLRESILLPVFACIVLGLASHRTGMAGLLARPPLVLLGKASYALYLLHASLSPLAKRYIFDPGADRVGGTGYLSVALFFLLYFLGAILVSVLVFKVVEEPARRWLRYRLTAQPSRPVAAL